MQLFPSLLMQGVLYSNPLASGDCVCKEADINHHASTHTHTHMSTHGSQCTNITNLCILLFSQHSTLFIVLSLCVTESVSVFQKKRH